MKLAGIDIAIFIAYLVVILCLGLYAARKVVGTKRDYFLAGDKLPWWMVGGSMVAANLSTHQLVGMMGVAYSRGFVAMSSEWPAIFLGINALLVVFLPFYLRNGFYTMPEFLDKRYGNHARAAFAGLTLLTYIFVEISAVLYLGSMVFNQLLGVSMWASIIIIAAMTALYTISGGLRAVVWTEMLQLVILMAGAITLSLLTLHAYGDTHVVNGVTTYNHTVKDWDRFVPNVVNGMTTFAKTSKDWHLFLPANDPDFPWTMYLGGLSCISIFYVAANQFIVQRTLAAKNEWHARMGVVSYGYFTVIKPLILIVPGLLAVKLFPVTQYPELATRPDLIFPILVETLLPVGLVGLVMAGLIAAVMSHISGALNSCSTIATVDFYLPLINKKATEAQAVKFGRIFGIVVVCIAIVWAPLIAKSGTRVFMYLLNAYGYFTPGIATMFLLGIFWKRTTNAGALTAAALTIPLSVVLQLTLPNLAGLNRAGIVFWACMLACTVVSLLTKPKSEEELEGMIWTIDSTRLPKDQRAIMTGLRNPMIWWSVLLAFMVCVFIYFR